MQTRTLADRLLAILLPALCVLCQSRCEHGLCSRCRALLPRVAAPCPRCALPGGPPGSLHGCRGLPAIATLLAPFAFAGPVAECIHALKYRRQRAVGRALALALIDACRDELPPTDLWLPVPLHRKRLRSRTFNQAEEIALHLARHTGAPVAASVARRRRATDTQSNLPASRRHDNVREAFAVSGRVDGLAVTVVDDVVTTGATVSALAAALAAAGARRVSVVAVARTIPGTPATADARPAAPTT